MFEGYANASATAFDYVTALLGEIVTPDMVMMFDEEE